MISTPPFILDERLAADSTPLAQLALCDLRLVNDSRYAWVVLVPRRAGLGEVLDLTVDEQAALWREVHTVAAALRQVTPCDKLNIASLGNVVSQLHIHVVARRQGDPAWPGPVWGHGQALPYAGTVAEDLGRRLLQRLDVAQ